MKIKCKLDFENIQPKKPVPPSKATHMKHMNLHCMCHVSFFSLINRAFDLLIDWFSTNLLYFTFTLNVTKSKTNYKQNQSLNSNKLTSISNTDLMKRELSLEIVCILTGVGFKFIYTFKIPLFVFVIIKWKMYSVVCIQVPQLDKTPHNFVFWGGSFHFIL